MSIIRAGKIQKLDGTPPTLADLGIIGNGDSNGHVSGLGDLVDVDFSTVATDGQLLHYDQSTGFWVPRDNQYQVTLADVLQYEGDISITESQISNLQSYLTSVSFNDLTSTPTTLAGYGITDTFFSGSYLDLTNIPAFATVATSGSYNDLLNKPTIPSDINDLSNVNTSGVSVGQVLKWNGVNWVPGNDSAGGAGASGIDSAAAITLITDTVDTAYVQARETPQDFAYSSLTGAPNVLDSADVATIAGGLSGLDSTGVISLVDSAYVQTRETPSLWTESAGDVYRLTGNVGIGTAPLANRGLHVKETGSAVAILAETGFANTSISFKNSEQNEGTNITAAGSSELKFYVQSNNSATVQAGGFRVNGQLNAYVGTGNTSPVYASVGTSGYTGDVSTLEVGEISNPADKNFLRCRIAGTGDTEFSLRGDGQAYADGNWNGGGADYAEYFEWSDGNPNDSDRRGITVVLDSNMIRPALITDDAAYIIGAVSATPVVTGDGEYHKWHGKYLEDSFGDYQILNGERILNPLFDSTLEYIPREARSEWAPIGLLGKLIIRANQPTGDRWIKLRDLSDSVEEWLVR